MVMDCTVTSFQRSYCQWNLHNRILLVGFSGIHHYLAVKLRDLHIFYIHSTISASIYIWRSYVLSGWALVVSGTVWVFECVILTICLFCKSLPGCWAIYGSKRTPTIYASCASASALFCSREMLWEEWYSQRNFSSVVFFIFGADVLVITARWVCERFESFMLLDSQWSDDFILMFSNLLMFTWWVWGWYVT